MKIVIVANKDSLFAILDLHITYVVLAAISFMGANFSNHNLIAGLSSSIIPILLAIFFVMKSFKTIIVATKQEKKVVFISGHLWPKITSYPFSHIEKFSLQKRKRGLSILLHLKNNSPFSPAKNIFSLKQKVKLEELVNQLNEFIKIKNFPFHEVNRNHEIKLNKKNIGTNSIMEHKKNTNKEKPEGMTNQNPLIERPGHHSLRSLLIVVIIVSIIAIILITL